MISSPRLLLLPLTLFALVGLAVCAELLHWTAGLTLLVANANKGGDPGCLPFHLQKNVEFLDCAEAKSKVIAHLVAGRMSLAEAVEKFRLLNHELECVRPQSCRFPLPRTDEQNAQNVLNWVSAELSRAPQRTAVLHRLEEERDRLFGHDPNQIVMP
jgi:hypothetical protein